MHVLGKLPVFRLPYPEIGVSANYINLHGSTDNVYVHNLPGLPDVDPV